MPVPQKLFGAVVLEVAAASRSMEHDENGHQLTWAKACGTLVEATGSDQ